MTLAAQAELAACLRLWRRDSVLADRSLYERSVAALDAAAPDPNRAMRAADVAPCVASGGLFCECRELLTEVLPYVRGVRPDLEQRVEAMVRVDVEGVA